MNIYNWISNLAQWCVVGGFLSVSPSRGAHMDFVREPLFTNESTRYHMFFLEVYLPFSRHIAETALPCSAKSGVLKTAQVSKNWGSPEDDQSILIETSSCNLQFFSELITTQLRDFHMVSPQVVSTLPIFLSMQSYKFYLKTEVLK